MQQAQAQESGSDHEENDEEKGGEVEEEAQAQEEPQEPPQEEHHGEEQQEEIHDGGSQDGAGDVVGGAPEGTVSDENVASAQDSEAVKAVEKKDDDEEEEEEDWMAEAERTNFGLKVATPRPDPKPVQNARHNGLASVLGSWIADLHIVYPNGEVVSRYLQQKALLAQIETCRAQVQKYKEKTPFEKGPDQKKEEKFRAKLEKLEKKIEGVHEAVMAQIKDTRTAADCAGCFVTFNHEESQVRCIDDYRSSGSALGRLFQPEHFRFMWHRDDEVTETKVPTFTPIRVEQAPEPTDVYWENLNLTDGSRFARKAFSNFVTFCLLLGSFVIAVLAAAMQKQANAEMASLGYCNDLPAVWYGTYQNKTLNDVYFRNPVKWVRNFTHENAGGCGAGGKFIVNAEFLGCPDGGVDGEWSDGTSFGFEGCVPNVIDHAKLPPLQIPFTERYDTVASGNVDPWVRPGVLPRVPNDVYYGGECQSGDDDVACPGAEDATKCPPHLTTEELVECPGPDCACKAAGTPTKQAPFYPTYDFESLCDDVCVYPGPKRHPISNKTQCASLACHVKTDRINRFSGWDQNYLCFQNEQGAEYE